MSNLKKILALVLALVMSFSLVTVSNAAFADLKDTAEVSANYAEAVEVLSDMGIFKGDNFGNFNPKAPITREEVATMMYRVISGDVADDFDRLYIEACDFEDGVSNWAKGFVGYCANGGYVKGVGGKNFDPQGNISGIAVLAMALRAVGYDKNNEFTGPNWDKNVLAVATKLGLLANIDETVVSLGQPATRELVAELIFRTMVEANKVTYTPAFGYSEFVQNTLTGNTTIGLDNFGLYPDYDVEVVDVWGRPGYTWNYDFYPYQTVIEEEAVATYYVPATECVLAGDLGITRNTTSKTVDMYVDGAGNLYEYAIQPADVVTTLGGQGTQLEVYAESGRLVVIHTWLALVTDVDTVDRDAAGHIIDTADIQLYVFDQANDATYTTVNMTSNSNYEYAVGDYVLVQNYTATNSVAGQAVAHTAVDTTKVNIWGKAEAKVGAQTYIWYNADKHTIDGVDYNDAEWYRLDKALNQTQQFNWLFDMHGNVIGSVELPAAAPRFAIIDNIQWINPIGSAGYAQATLRYIDNTTEVKTVYGIDADMDGTIAGAEKLVYQGVNNTVTLGSGLVSDNFAENTAYVATDLYQVIANSNGTVNLVHVNNSHDYGFVAGTPITANEGDNAVIHNSSYFVDTDGADLYVNEDTVFMVKKGNTWELVTGYKAVSSYTTAGNVVDYLMLDSDPYVEFMFVIGDADDENGTALFFRTSDTYRHHITANGVLCEVTGLVDGVEKTFYGDYNVCLCTTTKYAPYVLTYTNGDVTAVNPAGAAYDGYTITHLAAGVAKTWNGVVVKDEVSGTYYNVLGLYDAPTYGTWAANLTTKDVYILHKVNATTGDNVAAAVYIFSTDVNTTPGAGNTPGVVTTGYDLNVAANAATFDVTYMENGVAENVTSNVFFSYVAYVNGVETTTATNCLLATGSNTIQIATGLSTLTSGDVVTIIVTVGTETITESVTIA